MLKDRNIMEQHKVKYYIVKINNINKYKHIMVLLNVFNMMDNLYFIVVDLMILLMFGIFKLIWLLLEHLVKCKI